MSILDVNQLNIPKEIQLDCDWNSSTQKKYFNLIEEMKLYPTWENIVWSATIRLHQLKYPKQTGVPPVNKGVLMFYNMGNFLQL